MGKNSARLECRNLAVWLNLLLLTLGFCYEIVEQLENVPDGWSKRNKPPSSTLMQFRLELGVPNIISLEKEVMDLSTPGHPKYGQHMKREQVEDLLRPFPTVSEQVFTWLYSHVFNDSIKLYGNWISFTASISQAEQLLNTQFFYYHHDASQTTLIRTLEYSLPSEIHPHIHLIQPTTRFGRLASHSGLPIDQPIVATPEDLTADCGIAIRPHCLRELYGLHNKRSKPDPRNRLGVSGFLDQYARHGDFHHFMRRFSPDTPDANFDVVAINGGVNPEDSPVSSTEASLDIQYSASLAYNALVTFYTVGGRASWVPDSEQLKPNDSEYEPFLEQLHYLIGLPDDKLPTVLSTSYGESEQTVPASYAKSVCNLFAQLGARGVSVIFSSGDSGVGDSCLSNDGSGRARFQAIFPASCPFVTSVGGVEGIKPESAIDFSSGGFSDLFSRPEYQDRAVDGYLDQLNDQWSGLFNRHGRGIPDVAAQAKSFIIRDHETYLKISGTSASGPVFAGIVSQLNAVRLANGKPRMGFLNPWLYGLGRSGFTDIVDGGSRGCNGASDSGAKGVFIQDASWNATKGWDPVTGLGTPWFPNLAQLALSSDELAWTKYVVFNKEVP
ncbi:polynucleotide 3'-phosphatase [Penicillium canariense]|uniref:tripeptidyl-peptidase II n=1 Tax=Penicillium canariense TaxID=189055 RepID=A0A9W9LG12_9EURO|nr:polynucleotide 3'-phosphatase [Penicillium canariense]KAJ5153294.1 polynucleotide 3'-phosphatase [Penicillium canariense]